MFIRFFSRRILKGIRGVLTARSLQARIAEEAGAAAVMALERVPADIRVQGGVARMSDPSMIKEIMAAVTIPVMAKARIGHFVECQVCSTVRHRRNSSPGSNLDGGV
jgi:pyridoxal 5'-phosphate synthase pdxS subunit